jgi:class 3 adenylate cyclase
MREALGRVYARIDAALTGGLGPPGSVDPFEPVEELTGPHRERLDRRLDALAARGVDPAAVERLSDLMARGAAQEVARLRPVVLARRWGLDPDAVLTACLHAAREGLLVLLWDIICPICRRSCEVASTLRAIHEHGRCEACQLDFEHDFAASVELIFRAHPEVREAETGVYCAGGPAHARHVPAQVRVAPGERIELGLTLPEGSYRLCGPQLPWSVVIEVRPSAPSRRLEVDLVRGAASESPRALVAGGQVLALFNPGGRELLARVERGSSRDDALSAAQAMASAPFRDLFPGEVLSPGRLVGVASVTLLVTELDSTDGLYDALGDARAFGVIHEHFRLLDEAIRRAGGTLLKTVDEGIVASFHGREGAVRAGLDFQGVLAGEEATRGLRLRVGVHHGPAFVAALDGRLDYFGAAARRARRLLRIARGGELVMSREVAADPRVAALLHERGLTGEVRYAGPDGLLHCLATPSRTG